MSPIDVSVNGGNIAQQDVDTIVCWVPEGATRLAGHAAQLDRATNGAIMRMVRDGLISGRAGETNVVHGGRLRAKLHVGWALLVAITLFRVSRSLLIRAAGVALLALQSVAVVVTANHFFFDAAVGLLVCIAGWFVATWLQQAGYPAIRLWLAKRERSLARAQG